jgi:hypothetical protein
VGFISCQRSVEWLGIPGTYGIGSAPQASEQQYQLAFSVGRVNFLADTAAAFFSSTRLSCRDTSFGEGGFFTALDPNYGCFAFPA